MKAVNNTGRKIMLHATRLSATPSADVEALCGIRVPPESLSLEKMVTADDITKESAVHGKSRRTH